MKTPTRLALAMLVLFSLIASSPAVTFDVFKASATFTGFVTGVDPVDPTRQILIPYKLNTKQLINLARGRALKFKVPANEVLAGAGDASSMASFDPNDFSDAPQRLVVYNKDDPASAPLATILISDFTDAKVAENRVFTKFRRIGFVKAVVQAVGDATNGLTGGSLQVAANLTRKAGAVPPVPKQVNTATGVIGLVDAGVAKEFFVVKSVITVSGKRIGQFDL